MIQLDATGNRIVWLFVLLVGAAWAGLFHGVSSLQAGTVSVQYTYDNRGRLVKADYGAQGKITYVYDRAGNLLKTVSAAGSKRMEAVTGDAAPVDFPEETGPVAFEETDD